jgi:hypothetical protein
MAKRAEQLEIIAPNEVALAEHAAVIRALSKRVVGDVVEIGRRLAKCKEIAGHGGWLPWLKREFGWDERTAQRFLNVAELSAKSDKLSDLNLPVSGLYLLAAPSTPEETRAAVIERAEKGEKLTLADVKSAVDAARDHGAVRSTLSRKARSPINAPSAPVQAVSSPRQ